MTRQLTWVLEQEVFSDRHERLGAAVREAGQPLVFWDDSWWSTGRWPELQAGPILFHGSLGNADRIRAELPWDPGAFCNAAAFHCSAWYRQVPDSLLNCMHVFSTVRSFTDDPERHFAQLGDPDSLFVRPDSPLKPFSGRVVGRGEVSPARLDHGFYYDDLDLPIVLAPPRDVASEWRCVVVGGSVVAGSGYAAESRSALPGLDHTPAREFAEDIAASIDVGDPVYVMDVCESDGRLALLELNPFSGADLYDCDRSSIVRAISRFLAHGEP